MQTYSYKNFDQKNPAASVLSLPNGAGYLYLRMAYKEWIDKLNKLADHIILVGHLTDKMLEKFNQEGSLKVLNKEIANSILKGTISKIDEGPYTYSKEESISEYRYEVFLKLEWYDVLNEVNLISKT